MFRFRVAVVSHAAAAILSFVAATRAANIPVTPGLNAIAVPFVPSLNYSAMNLFSTALEGEVIYRWNAPAGQWWVFTYFPDFGGWISDGSVPNNPVFTVGEGIYYQALAAQTFVANFRRSLVPEIAPAHPEATPPPLIQNRYYFQGSGSGLSATYQDVFGGPPNDETALFRFIAGRTDINPTGPDYRIYHYKSGVWTPETPILNPLEPAFVVHPYLSLKATVGGNPKSIDFTWPRGQLEAAYSLTGSWELVTTGGSHSVTPSAQTNRARYYRVKE